MRATTRLGAASAALAVVAATTWFATATSVAAVAAEPTCDGRTATGGTTMVDGVWTGTDGDDVMIIEGTTGGLVQARGLGGNDSICVVDSTWDGETHSRLYGGSGDDALFSDWGHDLLSGGAGNDYLYGGHDNDTYDGGRGDDVLDGSCEGCGFEARHNDRAVFAHLGDVDLDLLAGTATTERGTDTVIDVDDATTGAGDDVLRGTTARNRLDGGAGRDRLVGRGGPDELLGGPGPDRADGGAAVDRCRAERLTRCER